MTQFVAQEIKIFLKAILNIKMGWQGLNSSGSGQGQVQAVVNMVMNIWVPRNAGNFLTSQGYGRFSTHTQQSISSCFEVLHMLQ